MTVIAHNIASQFTNRQLNITTNQKGKSAEKLSSGYRINRSADDAAGLQISEKMRWQVRGLNKASKNIQDGASLCQVADGALNETHFVLQRMRELSVQAANDTNTEADRNAIQSEIDVLTKEVDRIANDTNFNSDIYPLRGNNGVIDITNFSFDTCNVSLIATSNLSSYIYSINNTNIFDVKIQVNASNNTLGLYTMDGTKIYEGQCGFYDIATQEPEVRNNYPSNNNINFNSTSSSSSYFTGNPLSVRFRFHVFNSSCTNDALNAYLAQNTIHLGVRGDNTVWFVSRDIDSTPNNIANAKKIWIQMGPKKNQGMFLNLVDATANGIGLTNINVTNHNNAGFAITTIDNAIQKVSEYRSNFGAQQNRLEHAKAVDDNTSENTQNAESRIRDTDIAEEMIEYSKRNILEQAGQTMLAQANQSAQDILSLLS